MSRKRSRFDELMEAITFAEAGETEAAGDLAAKAFRIEPPPARQRILAVSVAPGFTPRMIENSLGMAERLEYGIVALNVPSGLAKIVAKLRSRGQKAPWLPAEAFSERAARRGIPFVHAIRGGDPEEAVREVSRCFRRIAFLLVEEELSRRARFAEVSVPIYQLADR